jgi:integrase
VFANSLGRWCHPEVVRQAFYASCEALEMPRITIHGLRHTAITRAIDAGHSIAGVSLRAGHSSTRMTDRYTHALAAVDQEIASGLGEVLAG